MTTTGHHQIEVIGTPNGVKKVNGKKVMDTIVLPMGTIRAVGKNGNAHLYQFAAAERAA